ncbi:hypothetical protein [Homoserinimonas hongtaonis]|uniref:Uncharacterized protein n=1 Tax=Homoserinimonas hongtaonis TaxID=2079791 RepID=A0A2U1T234_9MICO|nr:hypothetical protein [Salinibacterium hongtaonis]AWB90393.1 hypothetical protein C2138_13255 [Salinibacterium hongtaonis]PWB97833.1 hypothetical protein DF220_08305 [Salinibacterium hongtaonis]
MNPTTTSLPSGTFTAWSDTLDELERELTVADDVSRASGKWTAPVGLGQLPPELVGRARDLVERQQRMLARLDEERLGTGRHLAALRSVPTAQLVERSVYLDVAG